ncbi:MAG TPA: hypothetical protein VFS11_10385 [Gemmatimonadales bacterium]|nr:hypothetical protein [Gemmatimonadales bacterium]
MNGAAASRVPGTPGNSAAGGPRLAAIKLGGGISADGSALAKALAAIAEAAATYPLVVLPGGGPFADAVRAFDGSVGLSPDAAHWMAVLAMDQYAFAIADRLEGAALVYDPDGIRGALSQGRVPVLAPFRWMYAADVLPHSWEVTSDSIAAFLAGALDADVLVLLKPVAGELDALVDPAFYTACPAGLRVAALGPDQLTQLGPVLAG